jgi:hypothetical protein
MAEPENHTLRLLREIRAAVAATDDKVEALDHKLAGRIDTLDHKLDRIHADLKDRAETLTRALAGEIVQARYAAAAVDERLANIERRLAILEQRS